MRGLALTLLLIGGFLQLVGTLAIAWPDLLPWKERASVWLRETYRRAENLLRRIVRPKASYADH